MEFNCSMRGSMTIARLGGIALRAHWSLVVVVAIMVFGLHRQRADEPVASMSLVEIAAIAAFGLTGFLGSLVLHEFGHSIAARRHRIATEAIELSVFGGVARLRAEPQSPAAEAQIALAGPTVNLALTAVFVVVGNTLEGDGLADALAAWCRWLAQINIGLGLFNLIPATPLDGGRVVRAIAWKATSSYERASSISSMVSRFIGVGVMVAGVALAVTGRVSTPIVLMFVGWFLWSNAGAERVAQRLRRRLIGHRVDDVAWKGLARADSATLVSDLLAQRDRLGPVGIVVIEDRGCPVGLATIAELEAVRADERWSTTAGSIATSINDLPSAQRDEQLMTVLERVDEDTLFIVVRDGLDVVGVVTRVEVDRAPFPRPDPVERGLGTPSPRGARAA
jgi:Zn-dependent protease